MEKCKKGKMDKYKNGKVVKCKNVKIGKWENWKMDTREYGTKRHEQTKNGKTQKPKT